MESPRSFYPIRVQMMTLIERARARMRENSFGETSVTTIDLDLVLAALNQHQQRATYSAVAGLLDQPPRLLMHSRPREPGNSWVVSKTTGKPTCYAESDVHPSLTANDA